MKPTTEWEVRQLEWEVRQFLSACGKTTFSNPLIDEGNKVHEWAEKGAKNLRLRQIMRSHGLTAQKTADLLSVSLSTVQHWRARPDAAGFNPIPKGMLELLTMKLEKTMIHTSENEFITLDRASEIERDLNELKDFIFEIAKRQHTIMTALLIVVDKLEIEVEMNNK